MHRDLLDIYVKRIRARVSQGDGPTEPALSAENLEDAVLALADEVERLTRERDEAKDLADAALTHAAKTSAELTTLAARTSEVLAPFAEWFPEEALRDAPHDQRIVTTGLEARHFLAANTLFNELKEKDNGKTE